MTEGEFEKRIKKLVKVFDYSDEHPQGIHTGYRYLDLKEILKIVEEAKKEFPVPNIEFIEDPKLEAFAKELNKKQMQWFEKWFGT